jgi:hypothetical protein
MIKRLLTFIFAASLFLGSSGNYDTNAKIKAVYIYNFTKYVEWPKEYRDQSFVIGVLGETALITELKGMATTKKVFGQNIEVRQFNTVSDISLCHILYVPADTKESFTNVLGKIKEYSTLVITDKPGMATQGSAINFVVLQNRQKFELNESNAVKYKLKISNSLEALAIIVN